MQPEHLPACATRSVAWAVAAAQLSLALLPATASAQQPAPDPRFDVQEVMIPMRDGVKLHTLIYTPRGQIAPLPLLFRRTPYGVMRAARTFGSSYKELVDEGFIFAFQDIRGRYGSEGSFVMQRSPAHTWDAKATDESTDAYDTIEWLVHNVPNTNGRVGILGVSYDGWTAAMALVDPHPALRAASPQASPADMWLGDDFHHNGAFRLSYGFEYAARMETSNVARTSRSTATTPTTGICRWDRWPTSTPVISTARSRRGTTTWRTPTTTRSGSDRPSCGT